MGIIVILYLVRMSVVVSIVILLWVMECSSGYFLFVAGTSECICGYCDLVAGD